jgi:hypothetical protein
LQAPDLLRAEETMKRLAFTDTHREFAPLPLLRRLLTRIRRHSEDEEIVLFPLLPAHGCATRGAGRTRRPSDRSRPRQQPCGTR